MLLKNGMIENTLSAFYLSLFIYHLGCNASANAISIVNVDPLLSLHFMLNYT